MELVGPIVLKSKAFALRIIKTYQFLVGKKELVMSKQLLRAGTSTVANFVTAGRRVA